MKMIVHQTPGVHLPIGLGASFFQGLQKQAAIGVIPKNGLTPVTAIEDMINRSRIFDSGFARHASNLNPQARHWSTKYAIVRV
jgi:hypothetical protein